MARGGARVRSGPPPNPNSLRQDPGDWTHLPASGRVGEAPAWPLTRPSKRELVLWAAEWQRPQALMWEALGQTLEAALYVRAVVIAESPEATAADRGLILRQMNDLGLTVAGAARNRWIIDPEPAGTQKVTKADDPDRASAKARFQTIEGGGAAS